MTLLAPAFLLGLLGIALPIWLHRLSSDNPNRQSFSSLMFLEPGEPRRVLAKKLQYLLLLALRIAVLALLALAFAGPLLYGTAGGGAASAARLHAIVVDTSASMSYGDRWARAQQRAAELIGAIGAGEEGLLLAADRRVEVLAGPTVDPAELRQQLAALEPGPFHVDYGELMTAVDGVLRGVELPVVLHVVTDLQAASLPTRVAELAPRRPLELELHGVAEAEPANWAVERFAASPVDGSLEADIRSFADEAGELTLSVELNGERVAAQSVSVPANGGTALRFDPVELAAGPNRLRAVLQPGDGLPVDDQRFLVMKRPQPESVLLVSADPRGRDALFLASAFETLAGLSLDADRVSPSALAERSLADYAFVVVTDAGTLQPADAERLDAYAQSGGALLMAFGARSTSLAQVPVTGQRLPAVSYASGSGDQAYAVAGVVDSSHPALRDVQALRSARFFRFATITPESADRVLVSLEQGAPLLLERPLGSGRVLLFASTLDRAWTDLPLRPVFVPFVAGVAEYLVRGGTGFGYEAPLGGALALRALGLEGGQIFDPAGNRALGLGGAGEEVVLNQLGFYEIVSGGATELVAVNFDPIESDLGQMNEATLARWQQFGAAQAAADGARAGASTETVTTPLWPWILALLIAAAVMESWVGNWHLRVRRGLST